ncbi:MAG: response regulator [Oligoflexales bacterium]
MKLTDKISLLIVDDDDDILDLLVEGAVNLEVSKKIGDIHSASSVKKALALMNKHDIDVIFSDLRMPDEDGISLLQKAKKIDPSIIFIMMTGYSDIGSAIKAVREHAFDYIEKPIVSDIFEKTIVKAIRKKEMDVMIDRARIQSLENEKIASLGIMSASIAKEISSPLLQIKTLCNEQIESSQPKNSNENVEIKTIFEKISDLTEEINNIQG